MTLNTDFDQIISNLRGVVRMFKNLATKYSIFQQNIAKRIGKKLN